MHPPLLPTINASLNALAGFFLILGGIAIHHKDQARHRLMMICAFFSSMFFLFAYLYYHLTSRGVSHYQGKGLLKAIYFFILIPHTILAITIVPFILIAIRHALRGENEKHMKITMWLYPTWIYVSCTGVLVYLMLYVLPTA